jgi:hypothetical protein
MIGSGKADILGGRQDRLKLVGFRCSNAAGRAADKPATQRLCCARLNLPNVQIASRWLGHFSFRKCRPVLSGVQNQKIDDTSEA